MHRKYTAAITSDFCNKASTSASMQREEASTHKSAKTHAGTILWLVTLAYDLKINGFTGLIVEHLYVKFSYRSQHHTTWRPRVDAWPSVINPVKKRRPTNGLSASKKLNARGTHTQTHTTLNILYNSYQKFCARLDGVMAIYIHADTYIHVLYLSALEMSVLTHYKPLYKNVLSSS